MAAVIFHFCFVCFVFNLFNAIVYVSGRQVTGEVQFLVIPEVVGRRLVPGFVDQQVHNPGRAGSVAEMCLSGR